jgi:hypothetical protein
MSIQEIENKIKSIPGNEAALGKLYEVLDSGDAIAFVGAGASAGLWPLWDEFLKDFVDYGFKLGKITKPEADFFKKDISQNALETAQQLKKKIDDRDYFEYLQNTFKDKISPITGEAYTLTHKSLLQLPIHNYITLNYDAGLTNARSVLYPKATTSYYFWDQDEARRIIELGYKKLVLHAHGRHDRAESIILTLNDYRKAYDNRAYVRLLNDLFNYEKLIFIGFGMTDPYIKELCNNISKDNRTTNFQHIAIVGLDENEMKVAHLHRERVEMVYGARVIFYPTANHHKVLTDWLKMLVEKYSEKAGSKTAEEVKPFPASAKIKAALNDKYVHKLTDDDNFKGRAQDFATLNRWANDPDTRMIAITGIGGQGKTAMTGRWLKQERIENLKNIPVFYWSFYEDLDVKKFLEQIVEFCLPIVHIDGKQEIEAISFILSVVQQARLLLVLDGLEVLQEDVSSPDHGNIIHPFLYSFLQNWVRTLHKGLMILTSRFHFPQLQPYSGIGFHQLDLVRLSKEDGLTLLRKLNIIGDQHILEKYVEKLYGHPLALRVLTSAVKRSCHGNLEIFEYEQILIDGNDDELSIKLEHLLGFYEKQLKDGQKELIGIMSLFKRPVEIESFVTLLSKMKSLRNTPLANANASTIEKQLNLLVDDFLIEKTKEGVTTHPVIRDYFWTKFKIVGSKGEVADFLKARPSAKIPQSIEEIRDLVEAVQLFCDEGKFKAAHDLRTSRLYAGGFANDAFKNLPAITEGLECALAFVGDENRLKKVEEILGKSQIAAYCSGVSLYNLLLGNVNQALKWRYKSLEYYKKQGDMRNQAFSMHEISFIELVMGNIRNAIEMISQSLELSYEVENSELLATELACKAYFEFLLGKSNQSYQDFKIALYYLRKENPSEQQLSSTMGNQQAEFLIRLHAWEQFKVMNTWIIKISQKFHWNDKLAFCYLLQGWYEICQKEFTQAEKTLFQAEHILRPSGMLEDICRLDWVWALLARARGDYQKGLRHVRDALLICADKGFRLWQADNFILRGGLYLLQYIKQKGKNKDLIEKSGDDGNRGLQIAEETGYVWAKVDALKLLSSYHQTRARLPYVDKEKEKESAQRYTKEAASIEKDLFITEQQMEELKVQAKIEFEKQTAGWDEEEINPSEE